MVSDFAEISTASPLSIYIGLVVVDVIFTPRRLIIAWSVSFKETIILPSDSSPIKSYSPAKLIVTSWLSTITPPLSFDTVIPLSLNKITVGSVSS